MHVWAWRVLTCMSGHGESSHADVSKLERCIIAATQSACPSFVCFPTAVHSVARAAAALRGPRSHILLLGPHGVGRGTTLRVAAAAAGLKVIPLPPPAAAVPSRAAVAAFDDAFRECLVGAGCRGESLCLLLTEEHFGNATCMKRAAAVLHGDMNLPIPFPSDEWERLLPLLMKACEEMGLAVAPEEAYEVFLERAYDNMHVGVVASPGSDVFQRAVWEYPAIVDQCMVDMHALWPDDALLVVAEKVLADAGEVGNKAAAARAAMAVHAAAAAATAAPPVLHLRLLRAYRARAAEHSARLRRALRRGRGGILALRDAEAAVEDMRAELQQLEPQLAAQRGEAAVLRERSMLDSAAADAACAAVAAEEAQVAAGAAATAALRDKAQAALASVLPALEAAEVALGALNRNDIIEIKTFTKPPALVQVTMEAVCVLLGEDPEWTSCKRVRPPPPANGTWAMSSSSDSHDHTRTRLPTCDCLPSPRH